MMLAKTVRSPAQLCVLKLSPLVVGKGSRQLKADGTREGHSKEEKSPEILLGSAEGSLSPLSYCLVGEGGTRK